MSMFNARHCALTVPRRAPPNVLWTAMVLSTALGLTGSAPAQPRQPDDAQTVFDQAVDDFFNAEIEASVRGFDRLLELAPNIMPQLWQRGIALYYAGRYDACRQQFEVHRTVNPNDVENAAWHFLCVSRLESPEAAREALLPVGPDPRAPMREVYQLYAGTLSPEEVLAAGEGRPGGEFFAHLYVGLHAEAMGDAGAALEHLDHAAADHYARVGGYMHAVARVHLTLARGR